MDPQRIYVGRDISNLNRIVYRGLVTFPITDDAKKADTAVPGPRHRHRHHVEQDAKSGSSRSRTASSGRTARPSPARTSSTASRGRSPPTSSPAARTTSCPTSTSRRTRTGCRSTTARTRATTRPPSTRRSPATATSSPTASTSRGRTSRYAIASLRAFDPYRKDQDQGDKSNYQIFSNGPYKLEGKWDATQGGTFVRNPEYDAATDETTTRQANPDKIVFTQGLENEVIYDRLIADSGDDQYADHRPSRSRRPYYTQITGPVADRSSLVDSPFVDYLLPNFNRMKNLKVRQALMLSTDAQGVRSTPRGGDKAGKPAKSIVNPDADRLPGQPELHRSAGG